VSHDKSVRRSAQDDDFVGILKKNIPNKLALMGLRVLGSGNVVRHIRLPSAGTLNELSVKKMMGEATSRAPIPFAPRGTPRLIIKSISAKQRPRRTNA
jgi:hypothetical protein